MKTFVAPNDASKECLLCKNNPYHFFVVSVGVYVPEVKAVNYLCNKCLIKLCKDRLNGHHNCNLTCFNCGKNAKGAPFCRGNFCKDCELLICEKILEYLEIEYF